MRGGHDRVPAGGDVHAVGIRGGLRVPFPERPRERRQGEAGADAGADDLESPGPFASSGYGAQAVLAALLSGRGGGEPPHRWDGHGRPHGLRWMEVRGRSQQIRREDRIRVERSETFRETRPSFQADALPLSLGFGKSYAAFPRDSLRSQNPGQD